MKLIVNGRPHLHAGQGLLTELLQEFGAHPLQVAIMVNGDVIPSKRRDSVRLREGDEVELLRFVAGG